MRFWLWVHGCSYYAWRLSIHSYGIGIGLWKLVPKITYRGRVVSPNYSLLQRSVKVSKKVKWAGVIVALLLLSSSARAQQGNPLEPADIGNVVVTRVQEYDVVERRYTDKITVTAQYFCNDPNLTIAKMRVREVVNPGPWMIGSPVCYHGYGLKTQTFILGLPAALWDEPVTVQLRLTNMTPQPPQQATNTWGVTKLPDPNRPDLP